MQAFGNHWKVCTNTDFMKNLKERIWLIDKEDKRFYNELFNNENYKIISEKQFVTKYHDYSMNIILLEKVNQ